MSEKISLLNLKKKTLLLAAAMLPAAVVSVPADAAVLHSDASILTYTDFGQNLGRYAVGNTNALLDYLNKDGVKITYTGGQADYTLEHGMIDFSSQCDGGYGAALGYNFYATVNHNGVHDNTYTGNYIGTNNAIHYQGIEYRSSGTFLLKPDTDYKITRQSKLITDVTGSTVYGSADGDYSGITDGSLNNQILYRAGSGTMMLADHDGNRTSLAGGYVYITGGMENIDSIGISSGSADDTLAFSINFDASPAGVNSSNPLPMAGQGGDSGSPTWVWNENTDQYEYLGAMQSITAGGKTISRGAAEWTAETMASYDKNVAVGADGVVYVNGVTTQSGETVSDATSGISTTLWTGTVTDANGTELASFVGVKSGTNTWLDLNAVKDTSNWYAYGNEYLNASGSGSGKDLTYADLFMTENLVFKANAAAGTQQIILNADVDLGIGYVQFSKADGAGTAKFTVSSAEGQSYLLNSAGFVVDKGVEVHLQLTNPSSYMREWRKIGDGDLHIEGSGNNDALLNLGGNGTTYLSRENGYAAYNVLANNGTTVVIENIDQICRDFTFGFRGGLLDMNGNTMMWNNDDEASAVGFTIHALDEGAVITNRKADTVSTLTWTQSGDQTWLGSFRDTEDAGLKFVYDGGSGSSLTMHGIRTNLHGNEASGVEAHSGTLILVGTNTVHGKGSAAGTNAIRYSSALDWHYADMASDVKVESGATFELGSHARLTGDVSVADGGTFVMREGVQHQYEYIEGGYVLENTDEIADFFGLKGNVALNGANANLKIDFGDGVTSNLIYSGNITGEGNVSVALGNDGATLTLGGNNTFSGTKTLTSGGLVAESSAALGDVSQNKWQIEAAGRLAVKGDSAMTSSGILDFIDGAMSVGVLALTGDRTEQFDLTNHSRLIIGAAEGSVARYGAEGTTETLNALNGQWKLGGGGGELVVNFKLTGNNDLVLGNEYGKGVVTLANTANDFTGTVTFAGGVTLNCTDPAALGGATIDLSYTNRAGMTSRALSNFANGADGALLIDSWTNETLDLSGDGLRDLAVGVNGDAVFDGKITVAQDAAYRFGGATGTLTLSQALAANGTNDLIVDAQTYSGGKIVLAQKAQITGTVSVMASDSEKLANVPGATAGGDVTLSFSSGNDDALASAAATHVFSGGTIDLNGTTQTLNNLSVESGGSVVDSAGAGTLVVNSTSATALTGTVSVSSIEKTGAGTLTLSGAGNVSADTLTLRGGTVTAGNTDAFSRIGKIVVGEGATGTIGVGSGFTASLGAFDVAETGTLILHVNNLAAKDNNASGGTIDVRDANLYLNYNQTNQTQTIGGTLKISENSPTAVTVHSTSSANNVGRTFDRIDVASGHTVALTENSYNTIWTIHGLSGAGDVRWDTPNTSHYFTSRVILDGSGEDFTGTFTMNRNRTVSNSSRSYNVFLELAHDDALRNAVLSLTQSGAATEYATLAVNTENARMKGLNGTGNVHLYAGASLEGAASDAGAPLLNAPSSARQATLTFSGDGAYEFAGTVAGGDDGNGVSLVMNGAGTQRFTGSSITVNDVSALDGALVLAPATGGALTVNGNAAVARGATLQLGDGFSLDEGKTFSVLGSADATADNGSATFMGSLALNGGELIFSGSALDAGSTALELDVPGVTVSSGLASQSVRFTDGYMVETGVKYQLSNMNWTVVSGGFTASVDEDYLTATVSAESNGLFVTFTMKDGTFVWNGTETEHAWTDSAFGSNAAVPTAADTVYFDERGVPVVNISSDVSAGTLVFESGQDYTLSSENGSTLTASALKVSGAGTTTIESGVAITGTTWIEWGSELVVKSAAASLGDIGLSGTLIVDWSGSGTISGIGDVTSTLHVVSGQVATATEDLTGMIRVEAGGRFWAKADQYASFTLSGAGWNGDSAGAATLRVSGGATLSGAVSLTGDTAVLVAEGETGTISGAVSAGEHTLTKTGAGTLTLSGDISIGGLNVAAGELALSGSAGTVSSLSGDGDVSVGGAGTLAIGDMSGFSGTVTKTGTGTLTVETVSETASWRFEGASLGTDVNFNNFAGENATITLVGASGYRASDGHSFLAGGKNVYSQNFVLKTADGANYGLVLNDGSSGAVSKFTGKFTGDGQFSAAATTDNRVRDTFIFAGDVSEFEGNFQVRANRTFEFSDEDGATRYAAPDHVLGTGSIVNSGTVIFNYANDYSIDNAVSGGGAIQKTGAGTLTLTGRSIAGSTFTISEGAVALDGCTATFTSSLSGSGDLSMDENSSLAIENTSGFTGHFTKTGAGTLNITGNATPATASRWTFIGEALGARLNFNKLSSSADATIELIGASGAADASYLADGNFTFRQNFVLTSDTENGREYGLLLDNGFSNSTKTFTGTVSGDGKLILAAHSSGTSPSETTAFSGDLSGFTGGFSVEGNRILKFSDNGGATRYADATRVVGSGEIANTGTLVFDYGADHAIGNAISGSGTIQKTGAGTLTLSSDLGGTVSVSAGTLTLAGSVSGTLAVNAGTLKTTGAVNGAITVSAGSFNAAGGSVSGTLSVTGGTAAFSGGAGTLSSLSVADGGELAISDGGSVSLTSGNASIAALSGDGEFSMSSNGSLAITDMSGFSGTVTKTGTGTLTVTTRSDNASWQFEGSSLGTAINFNSFAGENATITLVGASGYRASDGTSFLAGGTNVYSQNFVLKKTDGANYGLVLDNGNSGTVSKFTGKFTGDGQFSAAKTKKTFTDKFIFAGDVSEFEGDFQVRIYRTFEFSDEGGATKYADESHVIGTGTIVNTGTVIFNYEKDHAAVNAMSHGGSSGGAVQKTGAGTLTLSGNSSAYSGTITISDGALVAANANALGTGKITDNARLGFDFGAEQTGEVANAISGSGAVEKTGAGTLKLSGNNSYNGGTTISEGKLVAASANALGLGTIRIDGGQLEISSGVTLTQTAITIVLNESVRTAAEEPAAAVFALRGSGAGTASATESGLSVATLSADEPAAAGTPAPAIVGAGTLANGTTITLELSETQRNEIANLTAGSVLQYYLWEPDTVSLGDNVFALNDNVVLRGNGWSAEGLTAAYDNGILTISSAIPEPSAFGLLAGTAALALAFSARRRKKKMRA